MEPFQYDRFIRSRFRTVSYKETQCKKMLKIFREELTLGSKGYPNYIDNFLTSIKPTLIIFREYLHMV